MRSASNVEFAVVGGGIIGLATAAELSDRHPSSGIAVLEKEPEIACHQTGHNSGVIHSGLYYRPGSAKAKACVAGAKLMAEFCRHHRIPYEICGKLVVATDESELAALHALAGRGAANRVPGVEVLGPERLREIEPHARGIKALYVPGAGIVDYAAVARALAELIERRGGRIWVSARVERVARARGRWLLETTAGRFRSRCLISCAGLHADRLAAKAGALSEVQIIPFRGEYFDLAPQRRFLVKSMIYPVPDPALPFLGVHLTRTISGRVHAGPNAVLALKREGYRRRDVDLADFMALVRFGGFWRMARKHWRTGFAECYRSLSKRAFLRSVQRLVPEIGMSDLIPGGSGVRAQAVDRYGAMLDDFNIVRREDAIYVRNVPSPAATASLCIARTIADMVEEVPPTGGALSSCLST